jgi:hypothetical protein
MISVDRKLLIKENWLAVIPEFHERQIIYWPGSAQKIDFPQKV